MNFEHFTFILERLTDVLIDKVNLLSTDTKEQLGSLQKQLEFAQSFVRNVDEGNQQATTDLVLQTKVKHLMRMIPKIEDFLGTFYVQDEVDQSQAQSYFAKLMGFFTRKHEVIKMATQLTEELQATHQMALPYQLPSTHSQLSRRRRPPTQPHIINSEFIIGLDEDVKNLVAKLIGRDGDNTTTLAIVGMGGAGKTTLARKIYNHQEITKRFTRQAWVCISQEWDTPQLLCEIYAQVRAQVRAQAHIPLAEGETSITGVKLKEFLQTNSCFIVLDDVWKKDALQEFLPILLSAGGVESSRVLITTRNEKIVRFHSLGHLHIHKARCLTQDESWNLFYLIVRNAWQGIVSFEDEEEFAYLGKEMLKICNGLPLAIIALAGLLSTKTTIQEWESTKNNVISRLMKYDSGSHDYGAVKEMLELSYFDLPYELKPYFLYLGIFKEDSHVHVDELIQLWIGEGFVRADQCNGSETLEEVAKDFLNELVLRNMVQIVSTDFEGRVDNIQIHDLMRDLCIEKAKGLSFFNIFSRSTSTEPMSYRAVMHVGESYSICNPHLRSIIYIMDFSNQCGREIKLELAFKEMKLLRVLHLTCVDLGDLEEQIGNLVLLRYLKIKGCIGVNKRLLESIKKLRNMMTFIYRLNIGEKIPNNMVGSMKHLRHLSLWTCTIEGPMLGVKISRSLQYLSSRAGEWLTKELHVDKMSESLRALELRDINCEAQLEAIYEFVSHPSNHLHELMLSNDPIGRYEFNLQKMNLRSWRLLKTLQLSGWIRYQPGNLVFPPNLLKLFLDGSQIEKGEDLEGALTQLHQLRCLDLRADAYVGDKLIMTGLPQLQRLGITGLQNLRKWRIEEGSLSQLKDLCIMACHQLERIPEGISLIHTLQSFTASAMPASFCKRLQQPSENGDSGEGRGEGEDFHLIRHIPIIRTLLPI